MTERRPYPKMVDGNSVPPTNDGFDVTCVIGRVDYDGGNMSPVVAAFHLIAEHEAPGLYTFPLRDGGTMSVEVKYHDNVSGS